MMIIIRERRDCEFSVIRSVSPVKGGNLVLDSLLLIVDDTCGHIDDVLDDDDDE